MSLTCNSGFGRNICRAGNKIISVVTNNNEIADNGLDCKAQFCLDPKGDVKFTFAIDKDTERSIGYITGPSGSGKSTLCVQYLTAYKKAYPTNKIYVFSALSEDPTLDKIKDLKRIKMNERLYTDPIQAEQLQDSMCIFDDTDVLSDKKIREAVYTLMNSALETGRHFKTSMLVTNHLPSAGHLTRRILNECHFCALFPWSGSSGGIKRLLEVYLGVSKNDFKRAKDSRSRWMVVHKNYPQTIVTEYQVWTAGEGED